MTALGDHFYRGKLSVAREILETLYRNYEGTPVGSDIKRAVSALNKANDKLEEQTECLRISVKSVQGDNSKSVSE